MKTTNSLKKTSTSIEYLIQIMRALRDPDSGCPWDIEQTFETIAPYTIEEAYEVADAINRRNMSELKDELGDLLLQVVYHTQIAEELGEFNFEDVAKSVSDKMITRHPHVFGDQKIESSEELTKNWENQKERERKNSKSGGALDGVAMALPALIRAYKLQKRAARVNFDWTHIEGVIEKLKEEIAELEFEIKKDNNNQNILEELGDILFSAVNVARKLKIDPEQALRENNKKFIKRFEKMELLIKKDSKNITKLLAEELDSYWNKAKKMNN